jgi:phosphoribosylformylglycinamidine synthase II
MIHEIRIADRNADPKGKAVLGDIKRLGLGPFENVRTIKVYRLEGLSDLDALLFARKLVDSDQIHTQNTVLDLGAVRVIEVGYKPGVMNPEVASILKMARDCGICGLVAADSSTEYHFFGLITEEDVERVTKRLLVNETVGRTIEGKPETLVIVGQRGYIRTIPIRMLDDDGLMALSKDKLFLNLEEMRALQNFARLIGRDLRDGEIQSVAAYWSEHCGHKTFKARIATEKGEKLPFIERLQRTSAKYGRGTISAFVDNSGVAEFYDGWGICWKVETHNSPSALEPFGGAATGVGGVLRDILGTGQGAKVILTTDMFCFAPPDLPPEQLPKGCLNPDYLFRRVVDGVGSYGNQYGAPTANGSVHFHPDFCAKPAVIVGAGGIIPLARAKKGTPHVDDLVIVIGGRTGRDGIHGATFSSGEMTERTATVNANAVQIGNAIEEKRVSDAIIELRDANLIRAITDCGAAGLLSAVGEIGEKSGVRVYLERAPLKYEGLDPWEIFLSESQERMVIAIRPNDWDAVFLICCKWNVEATVIGMFTDTHRLHVTYLGEDLVDLPYDFLLNGLPKRTLKATWKRERFAEPPATARKRDLLESLKAVLGHLNVCSKEPIVRRYDHGVQGTNALPPYGGVHHDAPNDAVVLQPLLGKPYGVIAAHGLNPILNRIDPYHGSIWAAVEALANFVAAGGNPQQGKAWLIDNFIWPFPDEESLGSLHMAVDACCAIARAFGLPFISGKDSLGGTYRGDGQVIKIPPVLNISVFGRVPDIEKTMSTDFKRVGSLIILVGKIDPRELGGSVYFDTLGYVGNRVPKCDLKRLPVDMLIIHDLITSGRVLAAHDVSEGGIAVALAEMCFGGDIGAELFLDRIGSGRADGLLFAEAAGTFLLEVAENDTGILRLLQQARFVGRTTKEREIAVHKVSDRSSTIRTLLRASIDDLKQAWQQPMKELFDAT